MDNLTILSTILSFITENKNHFLSILVAIVMLGIIERESISRYINPNEYSIEYYVEKTKIVENRMDEFRRIHDCDYVTVRLFHNGVITLNKIHLMKFTQVFESKKIGHKSLNHVVRDFPVSSYIDLVSEAVEVGYYYIPTTDNNDTYVAHIM